MTDLEKLLAIEEIRQLRPKYFRVIDAKQFDELEEIFTPDAVFDSREAVADPIKGQYPGFPVSPVSVGREAVVQGIIAGMPEALQSCHMGHTGEIEILSDTTAKGVIPFSDRLIIPGARLRAHAKNTLRTAPCSPRRNRCMKGARGPRQSPRTLITLLVYHRKGILNSKNAKDFFTDFAKAFSAG